MHYFWLLSIWILFFKYVSTVSKKYKKIKVIQNSRIFTQSVSNSTAAKMEQIGQNWNSTIKNITMWVSSPHLTNTELPFTARKWMTRRLIDSNSLLFWTKLPYKRLGGPQRFFNIQLLFRSSHWMLWDQLSRSLNHLVIS